MEIDRTLRGSIPQSERNDHFRASFNTLWSLPAAKACWWCIPWRHWSSSVPRDEGPYRGTYSLCSKDTYQTWAKVCTDWQRSLVNNLGVKKLHVYLFGRSFTLYTNHQPLTSIFHPRKRIPVVTAVRVERYALVPGGLWLHHWIHEH